MPNHGNRTTRVILKLRCRDARRFFEEFLALSHSKTAIVTAAFGYTGKYVARRLLDKDVGVRTLTRNPDREGPFGDLVSAAPLDFSDPDGLRRTMQGAGVLYNTYWIRFGTGRSIFDQAVENSRVLFDGAVRAGVERIVQFSVANASADSAMPYFRGKGQVEEILKETGIPTPSSDPPWSSARATCCSTTWPGRCDGPGFPRSRLWELPGPAGLCRGPCRPGGGCRFWP